MSESSSSPPAFPVVPDRLDQAVAGGAARRRRTALRAVLTANVTVVVAAVAVLLSGSSPDGRAQIEVVDPAPSASAKRSPSDAPTSVHAEATTPPVPGGGTPSGRHGTPGAHGSRPTKGTGSATPAAAKPPRGSSRAPEVASTLLYTNETAGPSRLMLVDASVPGARPRELETQPGSSRDGDWSPEGDRVAFVHQPDGGADVHIAVLHLQERRQDSVFSCVATACTLSGVRWSPDGRHIAFIRGNESALGLDCYYAACALWLLNLEDGSTRQLAGRARTPSWSADGRRLAYYDNELGAIAVMDIATSNRRTLFYGATHIDWGTDGTFVTAAVIDNRWQLRHRRSDGSLIKELVTSESPQVYEIDRSADGNVIAFAQQLDQSPYIWVVRSDGSGLRRLSDDGEWELDPRWRPRG